MVLGLRPRLALTYFLVTLAALGSTQLVVWRTLERDGLAARGLVRRTQATIAANQVAPVLGAGIAGTDWAEEVRAFAREIGARVIVTDLGARIVTDSFLELPIGQHVSLDEVTRALNGQTTASPALVPGHGIALYAASPVIWQQRVVGAVFIAAPLTEFYAGLRQTAWRLALIGLAVLSMVTAVSVLLAVGITQPVVRMTAAVRKLAAGDLGARVRAPRNPKDELGELAASFNSMGERLARLEASRRAFVADASHELRTPLASLKALIEPLLARDASPEVHREFLRDMAREIDRLSELAEDLLQLTRLEERQPGEGFTSVELGTVAQDTTERLKPLAEAAAVELTVAPVPAVVWGSRADLERALTNLIGNALKFTPAGGSVAVTVTRSGKEAVLSVADTGVGIELEHQAHLFERFYRVETARTRRRGGTGLGLAIVAEVARLHGGRVSVRSEPGRGSNFSLSLPLEIT